MLEEYLHSDAFKARLEQFERFAAEKPRRYRRRVLAMAWLGYWLVPVIMAVLLALPAYVFWAMFTGDWPLAKMVIFGGMWGLYAYGIVQMAFALFVPHEPVEGFEISETDAPALMALIERVRQKLDAPQLDRVVLVDDLNAAAAQTPKRSFLGGTTNELIIGLPLLHALEQDELESVIAHEFGHFSGEHGRDGFVVSRTIRAWEIVLATTQAYAGWTGFVPLTIARWFVPRFLAHSFALRRDNEFFADRAAVNAVGADAAGRALIRVGLAASHLETCRDRYIATALTSAYVPKQPLEEIFRDLPNASATPIAFGNMMFYLHAEKDPVDTHPGLRDRLAAIGAPEQVPPAVAAPAAVLLGNAHAPALDYFNKDLRACLEQSWAHSHTGHGRMCAEFAELEARAETDKLSLDDMIRRAELARIAEPRGDRLRRHAETVCAYPGEARALFAMGMYLAEEHDMRAEEFLDTAARLDETATGVVLRAAAMLAAVRNDGGNVVRYRQAADQWDEDHAERIAKLHEPCDGGRLDVYEPNGELGYFVEAIADNSHMIARAWLVTKPMPEWFEERVWLIVEPRLFGNWVSPDELSVSVYESVLEVGLPPDFRIWVLEKDEDWLRRQLADMPDAHVWSGNADEVASPVVPEAPEREAA